MHLHTASDKGKPDVLIESIFTAEDGRTFLVLVRQPAYVARTPRFLGELSNERVSKRLPNGGEESFQKIIVHNSFPARELDPLAARPPGPFAPPLLGMRKLRALAGARLTFLSTSDYAKVVGDRVFKLVAARNSR
jgi:hypothetical protein